MRQLPLLEQPGTPEYAGGLREVRPVRPLHALQPGPHGRRGDLQRDAGDGQRRPADPARPRLPRPPAEDRKSKDWCAFHGATYEHEAGDGSRFHIVENRILWACWQDRTTMTSIDVGPGPTRDKYEIHWLNG